MSDLDYGRVAATALQGALDQDDPGVVYGDPDALMGLARPGVWAGEIEARLQQLPHQHRVALRRAAREVARTVPAPIERPAVSGLPILAHQYPHTWWMRSGGTYVPVAPEILLTELSRAHPRVPTQVPLADGGTRPARPSELYELAGGVRVDHLVWRMGADHPSWDEATGTLVVPCCQYSGGVAAYSVRCDRWLAALAGERYDVVLDWIALHVYLDQPIAALYLDGPPSSGKGLFAAAVRRLWGGATSTYQEVVLRGWTGGLRRTPIVGLNERAARDPQERGSAAFRDLVGESAHELVEKYRPAATIEGCARLLITANGPGALRLTDEDLGPADEVAIGLRIVHVEIGPAAAAALATLGGRQETEGWADADGELVAHMRWVIETRRPTRGSRLLVEGDPATWMRGAARRQGLPLSILLAVAAAATGALPPTARDVFWRESDGVLVSCVGLHAHWRALTGDDRAPTLQALGRGLSRLGDRRQRGRMWVYVIPVQSLIDAGSIVGLDTSQLG